jgi:hypothetical protein
MPVDFSRSPEWPATCLPVLPVLSGRDQVHPIAFSSSPKPAFSFYAQGYNAIVAKMRLLRLSMSGVGEDLLSVLGRQQRRRALLLMRFSPWRQLRPSAGWDTVASAAPLDLQRCRVTPQPRVIGGMSSNLTASMRRFCR